MSIGLKADPSGNSGAIQIAGVDKVVVTNAGDVAATTFTGNLIGNADTATKFASTVGTAPLYNARAWVYFDGTRDTSGAVSTANTNRLIRGSGNVSTVLRNGQADYTITFTTPMSDAFYATTGTSDDANLVPSGMRVYPGGQATGSVRILVWAGFGPSFLDAQGVFVTVVR